MSTGRRSAFSPIFVLLLQEAYLASGSLGSGLTSLRKATLPDKSSFYLGFFNLSVALERIMKLIMIVDHMLKHDYDPPSSSQLKLYGHDLESLHKSCVKIAQEIPDVTFKPLAADSIESQILKFFSEFAKKSRYYNIDALKSVPNSYSEPLEAWEGILDQVFEEDVPNKIKENQINKALKLYELLSLNMTALHHGMNGQLLESEEIFTVPVKHELAAEYVMVRVFNLLRPILNLVSELGYKAFYVTDRSLGPQAPLFHEFFTSYRYMKASQIRKKKRWP